MPRARQRHTDSSNGEHAAAQPRPALGRRPWFALLRRARSLRRFALAIRRESVARIPTFLTLAGEGCTWTATSVLLARNHRERLTGVRGRSVRVLMRTATVHSWGIDEPLLLVGINSLGEVVALEVLRPRRMTRLRRAMWTLELPLSDEVPELGGRIQIYPAGSDRKTGALRHPHRQPR